MVDLRELAVQTLVLILAPLIVGLLLGLDRKLTARMQNRVGPPILQPFYDLGKLFGKERSLLNPGQASFAVLALFFQAMALGMLAYGWDLLLAFFLNSAGSVFIVLGAFSARSPFSHLGAQRELLQVLAYEPIIFLSVIVMGLQSGTFTADEMGGPMLYSIPLVLTALIPALVIKLQKSPYDIAHAHTELVSGPQVEYSGPYLGTVELAHWLDLTVLFWIIALFWYDPVPAINLLGRLALILVALFVTLLLDNATTRLTRGRMVAFTMSAGLSLIAVNLLILLYLVPEVGA